MQQLSDNQQSNDLNNSRPSWVQDLNRYARAAYEWHRRWPVQPLLTHEEYQSLGTLAEEAVQLRIQTWKDLDVENRDRLFPMIELQTDHRLELRVMLETEVCRELVLQPAPPTPGIPFPTYPVGSRVFEMLQQSEHPSCHATILDLEMAANQMVEALEEDQYAAPDLVAWMPTEREVLVGLLADRGYKLGLYEDDLGYPVTKT